MPSDRYEVQLTRLAEKDLERLETWTDRAIDELLALEENPTKGHTLGGVLKGTRALEFSLPGSGVYRAAYVVQPAERVCLVFIVGSHENIYREAERRVRALRRAGEI